MAPFVKLWGSLRAYIRSIAIYTYVSPEFSNLFPNDTTFLIEDNKLDSLLNTINSEHTFLWNIHYHNST